MVQTTDFQAKEIESFSFNNEWKSNDGVIYYYNINLKGETEPYKIGFKQKDPDFLKVGEELTYKIKDEIKRSIVRVQPPEQLAAKTGNAYGVGAMVGNAITNATALIVAGKVDIKDFEAISRRICKISSELNQKYS
jgi:hypothetical protein